MSSNKYNGSSIENIYCSKNCFIFMELVSYGLENWIRKFNFCSQVNKLTSWFYANTSLNIPDTILSSKPTCLVCGSGWAADKQIKKIKLTLVLWRIPRHSTGLSNAALWITIAYCIVCTFKLVLDALCDRF